MGGVTAQNTLCPSYEQPVFSSLKNPKLPEIVELPLVIVNGTFRCLNTLRESELEDFLRYLCKYTAEKEKRSSLQKPVWWLDDLLPHSSDFALGKKLLFVNNKACRMRQLVENAYLYYSSKNLIELSSNFSRMHLLSLLQFKICCDRSVFVINKSFGNVLVRIPISNMEYDFERQKKKKKESVLSEVQLIEVITLDDEEPQEDSRVVNNVRSKVDVRIFKSRNSMSKSPQIKQINDFADPVVVLSDSDEEVSVKSLPIPIHTCPSPSGKCKCKRRMREHSFTCRRKKMSLMEKLHNLQKTSSISFYPCINISDDDDDEEIDCQIIEDENKDELASRFQKIRDSVAVISTKKADRYNEENVCVFSDVSTASILSKKDEFLYNVGLVNKENMEQINTLIQIKQPARKLRPLKLPQYYMPLEILPLLVTRGVISSTQLEYNPNQKCQGKKLRKQRKHTRTHHIPPGVELKECHVVLTRLSQNILNKFEAFDNLHRVC